MDLFLLFVGIVGVPLVAMWLSGGSLR